MDLPKSYKNKKFVNVFLKKYFLFEKDVIYYKTESDGNASEMSLSGGITMNMQIRKGIALLMALATVTALATGCGSDPSAAKSSSAKSTEEKAYTDAAKLPDVDIGNELVALAANPAVSTVLMPVASGTQVKKDSDAVIDYSNTEDGYVMAQYTAATSKKLKAQVTGPSGTTYTYDLTSGIWATFPLSDGSGNYKVTVYLNISGTRYSTVISASFSASLKDEFAPFIRPNQYVNYANAPKTIAKAKVLCSGKTDPLDKVKAVYNYVVKTLTYDKQQAATVKSGYLPVLDTVLARQKGICFDYAALMTAMLRSQGVPCKLVIGYAGTAYHAWISVYSEKDGWITAAIYFDGDQWQRMDPTFASSGKQSKTIMKYIGDGSHYTAKYLY
jgi:hypothetical protein